MEKEPKDFILSKQLDEIIIRQTELCYADRSFPGVHYFLGVASGSKMILREAQKLNILSESTYKKIVSLQEEEHHLFMTTPPPLRSSSSSSDVVEQKKKSVSQSLTTFQSEPLLQSGQMGNFMNRFFITWKKQNSSEDMFDHETCNFCQVGSSNMSLSVRHMKMSDWLYLGELSKCQNLEEQVDQCGRRDAAQVSAETATSCIGHAKISAQTVLVSLKSIPVSARQSLPVLVNNEGVLVSIPVRLITN